MKSIFYKNELNRLHQECRNLDIFKNERMERQFHVVSASLLHYLPGIAFDEHVGIFKNILLNQSLSILDQDKLHLLNDATINGLSPEKTERLKAGGNIICTFHLGSYRLLNLFLAANNIPFTLVVSKAVIDGQQGSFETGFNEITGTEEGCFKMIAAEGAGALMQMCRELKKGKNLVIYIDGNTGSGDTTLDNQNSALVPFLNQYIRTRLGVGFLSVLTKMPVLPVISYRQSMDKSVLHFFDEIIPDTTQERHTASKSIVEKIYTQAAPFIQQSPEQWEAWLYLHKTACIRNYFTEETHTNALNLYKKITFNKKSFGLFRANDINYIFRKSDYTAFPLTKAEYSFLSGVIDNPVSFEKIEDPEYHKMYLNKILIGIM